MTDQTARRPESAMTASRARAALAVAALAALSACTQKPAPAKAPAQQASLVPWGPYPTGGDAHPAHARQGLQCAVCHDCGQFAFQPGYRLPSGTPIAGGTMVRGAGGTTCTVACHNPFSAVPNPIAWSTVGPLACVDCHVAQAPAVVANASAHVSVGATPAGNRSECQQCHDTSAHLSGQIRVAQGDGSVAVVTAGDQASVTALCRSCHDGHGRVLDGATAPLLPAGWDDTATGDWHGPRAGPALGTTLQAPFASGQPTMACTACHDPHRSANTFLLADTVNGRRLAPGAVARNGVGAEAFCGSCHAGTRHQSCLACHTDKMPSPDSMAYGAVPDPAGHPVDPAPAGSPCFFCHGHEGLQHAWTPPTPPSGNPTTTWMCKHCHYEQPVPKVDLSAPVLAGGPAVVSLTQTSATITWTTDEAATSVLEWGRLTPATVVSDAALSTSHAVALSGLTAGTTYVYRVRSVDAQRNVLVSPAASFITLPAGQPSVPALMRVPNVNTFAATATASFGWSASQAAAGHAVTYRVQASHLADFSVVLDDSGWRAATTWSLALPTASNDADARYYWRVMAQDTVTGLTSDWSTTGTFVFWQYDL